MTTPLPCICQRRNCAHYWGIKGLPESGLYTCMAYPTGIPDEILSGKDDHTESRGDDDGFTFELSELPGERLVVVPEQTRGRR